MSERKRGYCEDEEQPLTDQDLQPIDAGFESATSSLNKKVQRPSTENDVVHSAGRRLPSSIIALQHPNPHLFTPCQAKLRMRYPEMKFGGRILYSRTAVEVEKAAKEILNKRETGQFTLGFDIEWRPNFKKGGSPGKAAVMQICGDTSHCYVMHIFHSGIPQSLQYLLEDSTLLKVGVGIGNDTVKVFNDYNVSVKAVEDLSYLANQKIDRGPQQWGLRSLTETLISKELKKPKEIQLSNWETNFLSKEQLQYAATDAFASWYLYQVLKGLPDSEKVVADRTRGVARNSAKKKKEKRKKKKKVSSCKV